MANENLYLKYLGISSSGKPNHYVLLGVPFKESDPEVIAAAFQQRIGVLGLQKTTTNQGEITLLIMEISEARDCLLDDQRRRQYEFDLLLNSSVEEKNASSSHQVPVLPQPQATPQPIPPQPAPDPFAFQPIPPQPAPDPFVFQPIPPQPVPDPLAFQQPITPPPASDPFATFQQPVASQPVQAPIGFQQPLPDQPQVDPFSSPVAGGPAPQPATSHARKKPAKPDNTPYIIAIVGIVVILMVVLWSFGHNSPRSQAERLYNRAVTALNSYRYDEARALLDRAIALDPQESYVKYRDSIDKKQKNHEYTMRHRAAIQAED